MKCENCYGPVDVCHHCGKKLKLGKNIYCESANLGSDSDTNTVHFCGEKCWMNWLAAKAHGTETSVIEDDD